MTAITSDFASVPVLPKWLAPVLLLAFAYGVVPLIGSSYLFEAILLPGVACAARLRAVRRACFFCDGVACEPARVDCRLGRCGRRSDIRRGPWQSDMESAGFGVNHRPCEP